MLLRNNDKIILETKAPIAYDSPDYVMPTGTRRDNSINYRFNEKLYALFADARPQLRVLDLGCAGGAFVHMCIDDGCFAIGLEGSDYSRIYQRAFWPLINRFLHTCDITKPFRLFVKSGKKKQNLTFHAITCWEVLEHIQETKIDQVIRNILLHLEEGGVVIASICSEDDIRDGVQLHQTVRRKDWWVKLFASHGLRQDTRLLNYFNRQFVRGGGKHDNSFVLTLVREQGRHPRIPRLTLKERMLDWWFDSRPYHMIRRLLR